MQGLLACGSSAHTDTGAPASSAHAPRCAATLPTAHPHTRAPLRQVIRYYLAALMPGYERHGVLGILATMPRVLLLVPPWLAATLYVVSLSVAIATGTGALLGLQARLLRNEHGAWHACCAPGIFVPALKIVASVA